MSNKRNTSTCKQSSTRKQSSNRGKKTTRRGKTFSQKLASMKRSQTGRIKIRNMSRERHCELPIGAYVLDGLFSNAPVIPMCDTVRQEEIDYIFGEKNYVPSDKDVAKILNVSGCKGCTEEQVAEIFGDTNYDTSNMSITDLLN